VDTTTWQADASRPDWELVTTYVSQTQTQGAKVLDFGCYTGGLLEQLGPQYQRYGIEINRGAAAAASQHIGQNVWSSVDEIPSGLQFDAVIATDVVEHVTNPLLLIEQLSSRLSDNGLLIITTGDADNYLWNRFGANWWYCFYPDHISFLSRSWLDHVSDVAAVSVVNCESFRYHNSGLVHRFLDLVFVYWYGWFPSTFLHFGRLLSKLRGRPALTSLPGVGVSRDHLFIVLRKAAKP
jgi:SAM-dependent methyltransferase